MVALLDRAVDHLIVREEPTVGFIAWRPLLVARRMPFSARHRPGWLSRCSDESGFCVASAIRQGIELAPATAGACFSPRGRRKHSAELIQVGNELVEPAPPMRRAAGIRPRMSDERTI